jgi:hypothetical protein
VAAPTLAVERFPALRGRVRVIGEQQLGLL